jgi:Ca-activated chloride channel homolog
MQAMHHCGGAQWPRKPTDAPLGPRPFSIGQFKASGSKIEPAARQRTEAAQLTIHLISYRIKGVIWTGDQNFYDAESLAEENNGLSISAESKEDLVEALEKTLDCPMTSERTP